MRISHRNPGHAVVLLLYLNRIIDHQILFAQDWNAVCVQSWNTHIYHSTAGFPILNMKVHVTNSGFRLDTERFLSGKSVIIYIFSQASDAIAAHPGNRAIRIVYLHFKIRHL